MIPLWFQDDSIIIPRWFQEDSKKIPRRFEEDSKKIWRRFEEDSKKIERWLNDNWKIDRVEKEKPLYSNTIFIKGKIWKYSEQILNINIRNLNQIKIFRYNHVL